MKLNLDELKKIAESACNLDGKDMQDKADQCENFIMEFPPTVALALIERIEKLEGDMQDICECVNPYRSMAIAKSALNVGDS